jgi:hypothetical protein
MLSIHQYRTEHLERDNNDNYETVPNFLERRINQRTVSKAKPNLESLCPNFGWLLIKLINDSVCTHCSSLSLSQTLPCHTRWPAANVDRWNEDIATDTFFSDTPTCDDGIYYGHSGCTMAQLYAGKRSSKTVAYGMKSETQMPNTLEDVIRKHGAPNCIFSDNVKVQIGKHVHDILDQGFSM